MPETTVLMSGIVFGESPRWHDGRLWFSDWVARRIIAVDPEGKGEVIARMEGLLPFSIDWLPDGRLLVVSASDRKLLRRELDGSFVTHAELTHISDKPWNEIVVDGRGNIYLNNIGFDMMAGEEPKTGIVALVTPDRAVRQVADGVSFPNGMAITPDNATLIVAESYGQKLTAFDVGAGGLSNRHVWAQLDGYPDGICIDVEGAVWYADVPNKRCVRVREGGEVLQTIDVDRGCFACILGGPERKTLFIVVAEWNGPEGMGQGEPTGQVLSVDVSRAGAGWP